MGSNKGADIRIQDNKMHSGNCNTDSPAAPKVRRQNHPERSSLGVCRVSCSDWSVRLVKSILFLEQGAVRTYSNQRGAGWRLRVQVSRGYSYLLRLKSGAGASADSGVTKPWTASPCLSGQ